jgi:hypothetical protein
LALQEAGLILRQHQSGIMSGAIEDFYGTISTGQILQLAVDLLPFPQAFAIPPNLPSLTLTMTNVTGAEGQRVSCSVYSSLISAHEN